jgi:hypothetical protein
MKKYSIILISLLIASNAMAWPFGKKDPKPKPAPSVVTQPVSKPTIKDGRDLIKDIATELKQARDENQKLKISLANATKKLEQAEVKTAEVQKSADSLKEWGILQQAEAQKFMEKYNNAVKRYHRLKLIAAIIAAAGGVLLGLQFMNFAPPPYNIGVPVGAAALFAALVWLFL